MDTSLEQYLQFALDAAWQAGRITLGYFQTKLSPDKKADNTPVTVADRTAEQRLRELISRYWPEHGIIGEEFGQTSGSAELTWIIDPIDGTKSFVQGVPLYGVLIALTDGQSPLVGVAHFPALNETVYAARGQGCFWNGRRAHVSAVSHLEQAVLLASEGDMLMPDSTRATEWQRLVQATYLHRTWGDSYGYALVATGRAEIMADSVVKIWDCAPFPVILEEAGGTFTDWKGAPRIDAGESLATNGLLFDPVMALISPHPRPRSTS